MGCVQVSRDEEIFNLEIDLPNRRNATVVCQFDVLAGQKTSL